MRCHLLKLVTVFFALGGLDSATAESASSLQTRIAVGGAIDIGSDHVTEWIGQLIDRDTSIVGNGSAETILDCSSIEYSDAQYAFFG